MLHKDYDGKEIEEKVESLNFKGGWSSAYSVLSILMQLQSKKIIINLI